MDLVHRFLKPVDQAQQPTLLPDRLSLHHNPNKVDTAATQFTSNSNFTTAKPALMGVLAELVVTKQLVKATKTANTEVTKDLEATTMAITSSSAADGAATMEVIKYSAIPSSPVLVDCRLCFAWNFLPNLCYYCISVSFCSQTRNLDYGKKEQAVIFYSDPLMTGSTQLCFQLVFPPSLKPSLQKKSIWLSSLVY